MLTFTFFYLSFLILMTTDLKRITRRDKAIYSICSECRRYLSNNYPNHPHSHCTLDPVLHPSPRTLNLEDSLPYCATQPAGGPSCHLPLWSSLQTVLVVADIRVCRNGPLHGPEGWILLKQSSGLESPLSKLHLVICQVGYVRPT